MEILHINSNYVYTWLHQKMIEHLDTADFKSTVFCPISGAIPPVVKPNDNVVVTECFGKYDKLIFDNKQRKIFNALKEKIDVKKFSMVHAYTLFTDGNCALQIKKKYGIPYVVAVRNVDVNTFFRKAFYLRSRGVKIMREASAVFFLSESYRNSVIRKYVPSGMQDEIFAKSKVIPNGIDDFWFANAPAEDQLEQKSAHIKEGVINIVYAGRIDKNKNIPTTQKAMEILAGKGYKPQLTIIGPVADQNENEKISRDERTLCLPAMPKEELIHQYRQNDIFVMPSFFETFGLVYAEALSQGLPVVYSKGQGFDGQFEDGYVGYSVSSDSPEEVADAIVKICDDYPAVSKRTVPSVKKFDWSLITGQYREIYGTALSKPAGMEKK